MTELPVRIEWVRIGDLVAFARNVASDPVYADTSPTSLLRAASQAANPHAAPDDVALLVATHAGRCVGYQGLLPGALTTADGLSKVSWLITFYVAPAFRGRGIGARLVREALALRVDLVATGVTRAAERAYRSAGFQDLGELGCRRFSLESFPRPARWLIYTLVCSRLRDRWKVRPVACISPAAVRGWEPAAAPQFPRGVDVVNWMLTHPWVVSRPDAAPEVPAYFFSSVRDLFRFEAYEVGPATEAARGAFVLSATCRKGRTQVKLLDGFFPDPAAPAAAAGVVALRRGRDLLAHRIDFPLALEGFLNASRFLRRLTRRKYRLTLCRPRGPESPLAGCAGKIRLDYCDGDSAFT